MRRIAGDWMPCRHRANDPDNWRAEFLQQFEDAFDAEYQGQEAAHVTLVDFISRGRELLKTPGVEVYWLDGEVRVIHPGDERHSES